MTLNEYQDRALDTCLQESRNTSYMLLNLVGEVGEFSGKIGKYIRKGEAKISENDLRLYGPASRERDIDLMKEAGDILWQLSGLCYFMGWRLEDVASQNLAKLADRKKRGVIDGNGDER